MATMRQARWAASLALLLWAGQAAAASTLRYLMFTGDGRPAGEQVSERGDDGVIRVRFRFKDNGRGPELQEEIRLAPDGTLADYRATGTTTLGAPIDERFSRDGAQARWKSTSESGSATPAGPALYVPTDGSWEALSQSIGVLARAAGATLPTLPGGSVTQRRLDELELVHEGRRQRVQLLAQTGLDLQPWLFWATTDEQPRLFAAVIEGWQQVVEAGWESQLDLLTQRQLRAQATLLKDLARQLQTPLPGLTVVRNARLFDSVRATLGPPSDVFVLRGRITAIRPAGSSASGAAQEIDAAGRVMLPGLFDMHGHAGRWDGGLHLAAGVTTVRDMGSVNPVLQGILDEIASGELMWPRIEPCGFLEGEGENASSLGIHVRTLAQARDAVDWYAARGYRQIKIYNSFPREILRETVAHAHARGLRVSGHVPVFLRASEVVAQGFDELQHINQVLLNFFVTPTTDTRTITRFVLPAERAASLDLDSKPVRAFIADLRRRGTVVDPTLVTFDFIRQRPGETSAPYRPVVDHLPVNLQRYFRSAGLNLPDEATARRYAKSYDQMVKFVGRLYRAGVPLVAGTDAIAGFTLHAELAMYVQAGLTPAQALQVATRNGARYSGTWHERGSLDPGKLADLVLVDGEPTRDIADLRRVAGVMTQGRWISPPAVHQALGVRPFVSGAPMPRVLPAAP